LYSGYIRGYGKINMELSKLLFCIKVASVKLVRFDPNMTLSLEKQNNKPTKYLKEIDMTTVVEGDSGLEERKKQREELLKRNFGDSIYPESLFHSYPQSNSEKVIHMVKEEIIDYAIKQMGEREKGKPGKGENNNK